jgi:hypothetical protein
VVELLFISSALPEGSFLGGIMRFVNRELELAGLEREYASSRFSFVIIYGRRRLGKTRLIQSSAHFMSIVLWSTKRSAESSWP